MSHREHACEKKKKKARGDITYTLTQTLIHMHKILYVKKMHT